MNPSSHEVDLQEDPILARFKVAQSVIRKAGSLANEYFRRLGSLTIKSKGSHDLVSEADVNTELLISSSFKEHFPDDAFFGEESGHTEFSAGHGIWVVDPIDGTQPFLSGMPNWCISIAFVLDGQLQFGLVYNPPCDELFAGEGHFPRPSTGIPSPPIRERIFQQAWPVLVSRHIRSYSIH